jgi:hypothetical protein
MTYLIFATETKRLVRHFQNWAGFYGSSLTIPAMLNRKDFGKGDGWDSK